MKKIYFLSVALLSVFMFFGFSNSDNPNKMTLIIPVLLSKKNPVRM